MGECDGTAELCWFTTPWTPCANKKSVFMRRLHAQLWTGAIDRGQNRAWSYSLCPNAKLLDPQRGWRVILDDWESWCEQILYFWIYSIYCSKVKPMPNLVWIICQNEMMLSTNGPIWSGRPVDAQRGWYPFRTKSVRTGHIEKQSVQLVSFDADCAVPSG